MKCIYVNMEQNYKKKTKKWKEMKNNKEKVKGQWNK